MSFLNWVLLGGTAAFSIPLLIHLLNRSRYQTIEWGAMHLLDTAFQANNKRIRIEQLILLLVRCSIPVLLALCLARPVLTAWKTLPGETPQSVVVLLDNSYSMEIEDSTGTAF
ncbi:MAG: BatA domain-containing protein, partial [Pseudomonadota bacterium]